MSTWKEMTQRWRQALDKMKVQIILRLKDTVSALQFQLQQLKRVLREMQEELIRIFRSDGR